MCVYKLKNPLFLVIAALTVAPVFADFGEENTLVNQLHTYELKGKKYTVIREPRYPGLTVTDPATGDPVHLPIIINKWTKINGVCKLFNLAKAANPESLSHDYNSNPAFYISKDGKVEKRGEADRERITEIECEGELKEIPQKKDMVFEDQPTYKNSTLPLTVKKSKHADALCKYLGHGPAVPNSLGFFKEQYVLTKTLLPNGTVEEETSHGHPVYVFCHDSKSVPQDEPKKSGDTISSSLGDD